MYVPSQIVLFFLLGPVRHPIKVNLLLVQHCSYLKYWPSQAGPVVLHESSPLMMQSHRTAWLLYCLGII